MKIQIDPKVQMIVMAIVALLYIGAQNSVALPLGIPEWVGPYLHSWSNFLIQIYLVLAPILLPGLSSSLPGPLAPPDPPAVKAAMAASSNATKAISLVALVLAARGEVPAPVAGAPVKLPIDPLGLNNSTPTSNGTTSGSAAGPLGELNGLFASDFAAAAKLATSTSIKDGNGQACWMAFQPLGEVINAHPEILTGKLATDIEAKRLAVIAARNLCNNVACNTVFTEEANMAQNFVKSLPVSVTINATPVNLFANACAAIPTLQVAPAAPAN